MRIGLISDTHDATDQVSRALNLMQGRVDMLVHTGDITKVETVSLFEGWKTAFVWGNMDRDRAALLQSIKRTPGPFHFGASFLIELDHLDIGFCHGDKADLMEELSMYCDIVCHGHIHQFRDEQSKDGTRIICPGAVGGGGNSPRSCAILDTDDGTLQLITL
ncbi:MAG: metallophosphoesterase family protein [Chloroflexota bacterium]